MAKNIRKEITRKIVIGLAVRGGIALLTGGVGMVAWEAIEGIAGLAELAEAGADFFSIAEEAKVVAEAGADVSSLAEAGADVSSLADEEGLRDLFQLSPGILASTFALAKVDVYLGKLDVDLIKETRKRTKQLLNPKDLKEIKEIKHNIQNEKNADFEKQKLSNIVSSVLEKNDKSKELYKSLTALALAAIVSVNSLAVNDFITSSPNLVSSLKEETNPQIEQVIQGVYASPVYQDFFESLENKIRNDITEGVTNAILN